MSAARDKSGSTASGAALRRLILETFRLNGRLLTATDRLSRGGELSAARWHVLQDLEGEPRPVAHVARNLGLRRQSVQRTVDLLAEEGLVTFAPNPHHRRARLVVLTDAGRSALGEVESARRAWTERIAADVPADDLESAADTLRELRIRLDRS